MKTRGYHSDDGIVLAVECQALAQNVGSRTEFPLPQAGADHRDWFRADLVFACCETAAQDWIHPERWEKIRRNKFPIDLFRLAAPLKHKCRAIAIEENV